MTVLVDELLTPIAPELVEFERRLEESVRADFGPMADAMEHIVRAGGKRLRPALVLLSAALGTPDRDHTFNLAMGIEFIHTATLVHDDLIDDALTRRGITTIHETVGVNPAIIIGDYYFAKGANLLASIGEPSIDLAISNTVMTICLGELLQLTSRRDYEQTLEEYHRKIARKTAALVETCCYCGAIVGQLDERRTEALRQYGYLIGMAFQIADDVLDYTATAAELGKPVGADLRQGTVTLPLMLALDESPSAPALQEVLAHEVLTDEDCEAVVRLVRQSGAIERTEAQAHDFAQRARAQLAAFDPSPARATLEQVCDYVVDRRT
ncbi:MAG: polyprenyl synthetase family protein [Candidatus Dormibacteraeota bacterium]|uniref:Heptaprenyl diphosphate synthase n=1 Tax=Candidatus Aeolococcus gillhamiae TaxID=3127015 RepID=A0A2W5ZKS5_9BACT|nr:polyprenyl synthetase family protein [Candidatus Dormibacteraeota bacterium]PZR83645.1 MAG: heptaprenyl diphosphate synthase [Candidatus Dormibacter sp. RRmetagenome_bin12]